MGASPKVPSREGTLLGGKYLLSQRLGAGGMGEVYRARNELIGREVAIKTLRAEYAQNAEVVARFLREARAANIVRHPHVVDVLDVGTDEHGVPFIVQELLHGEDLAGLIARSGGALPVGAVLAVMLPIVEAVAVAHARGVVHRDLKPENVFLAQDGARVVPKVLDFGISKITDGDTRTSTTGVTLGTPAYMSPEQIASMSRADARSDVWSLGVILHELVSGTLPFQAESPGGMFVQVATQPPIALEVAAPHAPPALARVVARCLRATPGERYPNAEALAVDLRALAVEHPPATLSAAPIALAADGSTPGRRLSTGVRTAETLAEAPASDVSGPRAAVVSQPAIALEVSSAPASMSAQPTGPLPDARPSAPRARIAIGTVVLAAAIAAVVIAVASLRPGAHESPRPAQRASSEPRVAPVVPPTAAPTPSAPLEPPPAPPAPPAVNAPAPVVATSVAATPAVTRVAPPRPRVHTARPRAAATPAPSDPIGSPLRRGPTRGTTQYE